jgi:hypothetical protein
MEGGCEASTHSAGGKKSTWLVVGLAKSEELPLAIYMDRCFLKSHLEIYLNIIEYGQSYGIGRGYHYLQNLQEG